LDQELSSIQNILLLGTKIKNKISAYIGNKNNVNYVNNPSHILFRHNQPFVRRYVFGTKKADDMAHNNGDFSNYNFIKDREKYNEEDNKRNETIQ